MRSGAERDEVQNITFGKGLYDASQVDELLDRIATELDAGRPAGPLIASATFKRRPFVRGYNAGAVDWFLEQPPGHPGQGCLTRTQ